MQLVNVYCPETRLFSAVDSQDLDAWIDGQLKQGCRHILINFKNVLFIDSQGIGALMKALKKVRHARGTFGLCSVCEQANLVINMAGIGSVLKVFESPQEFYDYLGKLHRLSQSSLNP